MQKQLKFSTRRVQVIGAYGFIRHVHPNEARRLCADGASKIDDKSIQLAGTQGLRHEHRASTSSLKTTFVQKLSAGNLIQHKHINPADECLYRLAVTENFKIALA